MRDVNKHPIAFEAVTKGTVLSIEDLIQATGAKPGDGPRWNFALISLKDRIEDECGFVCKIEQDTIRVLTDQEACDYTFRRLEVAVRSATRNSKRRALIDRSGMTEQQRRIAESRDRISLSVAEAARAALRKQKRLEGGVYKQLTGGDE